jgi:glycosyltransferase involved in cell wall biosynthesis
MKIIHITTVPFTFRFYVGHIRFLKSHGVEVHGISSPSDELGSLEEVGRREGIPVHPVRMERRISPCRDIVSLWHLCRVLRQERPDIVHSHTPKGALLGTIAARAVGVKVVLLTINGLRQMTKTGLSRRVLDAATWLPCRLADRVWCDCASLRDYLIRGRLCPPEKTILFGSGSVMGVDAENVFSPARCGPEVRQAIRAEHGIPRDATVLGFLGRIVADKGMRELAAAWRDLRDQYPDLHLLLVGPFDSTDPLSAADEALFRTDDRIHLTGLRNDAAEHLAAMDVFVMPSYREGFGVVNIEAAAMALPVVSTRIPGCVDSVRDGATGTLVAPRDADMLRAAIVRYLDDPVLRWQHGQAGRQRVLREFRPEDVWQSLYRLYLDLIRKEPAVRLGARVGGAGATRRGAGVASPVPGRCETRIGEDGPMNSASTPM